jgi:hypothetical protein
MKLASIKGLAFVLGITLLFSACRKKDAPLPDNLIQFETTEQGFGETEASKKIVLVLTRASATDVPVQVSITPSAGLEYTTDFTTDPAASAGVITLNLLSGNSNVSFTVKKTAGALFDGEESITFKITSSGSGVIIGTPAEFKLNFSEIISTGSEITGTGGGATYGNKVFFDLSANSQTPVERTKWDLGFYTGAEFSVILNSSTAMMATPINKTDLNAVSTADTVGLGEKLVFNQLEPTVTALPYIDYPTGDLSKTAIAPVSATLEENKVYIINRGTGIGSPAPKRGWKKIRVIRNAAGGYTLQHADIAATTFTSIDIAKDAAYFFNYVSFENGAVEVEPKKQKWDIAWAYFSNVTNFGAGEVPYLFQDFIVQNRNVQISKVLNATKPFDDFTEADLAGLTFNSNQNGIGSDWRAGGGPGVEPAVRADRYYIIKDGDGNYYKVKFTGMTQQLIRGFPAFKSVLVKKA